MTKVSKAELEAKVRCHQNSNANVNGHNVTPPCELKREVHY